MKYLKTSLIGIIVALMLSGCIVSLHPLYTKKDIIFEPDLIGQWSYKGEGDRKGTWEFQKLWNNRYKLVHTDKDGKEGRFLAILLKVKDQMFLDLQPLHRNADLRPLGPEEDLKAMTREELREYAQPLNREEVLNSFYEGHLLFAHTFYHVKQITPVLQFRGLDPRVFQRLMDESPKEIHYEDVSTRPRDKAAKTYYVMTSQPKELQEFLVKHLDTRVNVQTGLPNKPSKRSEGAFTDFSEMHRISPEGATKTKEKELNTDADASSNSQSDSTVPQSK